MNDVCVETWINQETLTFDADFAVIFTLNTFLCHTLLSFIRAICWWRQSARQLGRCHCYWGFWCLGGSWFFKLVFGWVLSNFCLWICKIFHLILLLSLQKRSILFSGLQANAWLWFTRGATHAYWKCLWLALCRLTIDHLSRRNGLNLLNAWLGLVLLAHSIDMVIDFSRGMLVKSSALTLIDLISLLKFKIAEYNQF